MGVPIIEPLDDHESSPHEEPERPPAEKKRRSFFAELPILVLVALVVAVLIKTFLVQAFYIPSMSMAPTLEVGDRVLVNKLAYRIGDVGRGDIVVFDSPFAPDGDGESIFSKVRRNVFESLGLQLAATQDFIKRVIAVGGDVVEVRDNVVLVNGRPIAESYLVDGASMPDYGPETVPAGAVFVMGDNRSRSQDSRRFGPISDDEIIGRAFVRVWPLDRFGGL